MALRILNKRLLKGSEMGKKYILKVNCKDEKRAESAARDFIESTGQDPDDFNYIVRKVKFYTFEIITERIKR